ncbi:hypothetical protein SAMN04489740_2715 [Arthrobacter alpinus]|uniref:Uncharacterized protein n=1 Tax=Arthrobacter alpinus TaxID=656366 RepID=A0A1H5M2F8_9MICC|nr:hypothetical protein [Arthrobacter alpinus]SEE83330.1 hypothetical protein SAMN04489740_2715 [Arthrobacter alpinus]
MSKFSVGNWVRVTRADSTIFDEVGQVRNISRWVRWWEYVIVVNGIAFGPIEEHFLVLAEEPATTEAAQ